MLRSSGFYILIPSATIVAGIVWAAFFQSVWLQRCGRCGQEDGSGTLESDEIAMLAVELGNPMTDEEVAEAMEEMDADGGGDVDWEEFLFW